MPVGRDQPVNRTGDPVQRRSLRGSAKQSPPAAGVNEQRSNGFSAPDNLARRMHPQQLTLSPFGRRAERLEIRELPGHDLGRYRNAAFDEPDARRAEGTVAVVDEDGLRLKHARNRMAMPQTRRRIRTASGPAPNPGPGPPTDRMGALHDADGLRLRAFGPLADLELDPLAVL
jgi:hypothetical protein